MYLIYFAYHFEKAVSDSVEFYEHDTLDFLSHFALVGLVRLLLQFKRPFISPPRPILSDFHFAFFQPPTLVLYQPNPTPLAGLLASKNGPNLVCK